MLGFYMQNVLFISVCVSAQIKDSRFLMRQSRFGIEQSTTNAWITTGGTDSGVMQLVGKMMRDQGSMAPCIGICSYGAIHNRDTFTPKAKAIRTTPPASYLYYA